MPGSRPQMVAQSIAVQLGYALIWEWDYINELDLVWELDIQKFELLLQQSSTHFWLKAHPPINEPIVVMALCQ